jgi:hypothetical protein
MRYLLFGIKTTHAKEKTEFHAETGNRAFENSERSNENLQTL